MQKSNLGKLYKMAHAFHDDSFAFATLNSLYFFTAFLLNFHRLQTRNGEEGQREGEGEEEEAR